MTNSAELLKLAQELNAVDIINSEDSRINRIRKPQVYKYLLSVDFEATCWRDKQYNTKHRSPEIIEFPAVLINLENGEILREFQQYVKPTENPILTDFCTELTGIRQDQVKSGISIQQCIVDFHVWLTELQEEFGLIFPKMSQENKTGNVAFVTYSDWDFGVCLARECGRKRLKKPSYFEQWIDLRAIYRAFYNYKSKNFADALNHVGLKFVGRQHSGLDDARNAARLCYKMKRDGAFFAITKDLNPYKEFNKPFELSTNRS